MKISRLLAGIGGGSILLATAFAAQAGSLSPALAQLEAAYSHAPAAVVKSLAMRPGAQPSVFGPRVSAAGAVQVYIHYQLGGRPAPAALDMLGATHIRAALGVVQAWVPIARLRQLTDLSGVTRVGLPAYAIVRGLISPQPRTDTCIPYRAVSLSTARA